MSALLIAQGLVSGQWSKIAIIDSENGSADLYADLGPYQVLTLDAPYSPERYITAIQTCEAAGMEVIIIDSISHCWEYLLDYHANLPGNSFTAWSKVTPRHNAFINRILTSSAHIISTARTKTEYVLAEKNGKQVPEKVGLKSIQRDGIDYEFSLVFDLNFLHNANITKDRTRIFVGCAPFRLGQDVGETLLAWSQEGSTVQESQPDQIRQDIEKCQNMDALAAIYHRLSPEYQIEFRPNFQTKKKQFHEIAAA